MTEQDKQVILFAMANDPQKVIEMLELIDWSEVKFAYTLTFKR